MPRLSNAITLLKIPLAIALPLYCMELSAEQDERHQKLAELFSSLNSKESSKTRLGLSATSYDGNYIYSATMNNTLNENVSINGELDSTGYLSIGASYGKTIKRWYAEGFTDYGRADFFDVFDIGIFAVRPLGENYRIYFTTSHQWRENRLVRELYYQRQWQSSIGISHRFTSKIKLSFSANYDHMLKDIRLGTEHAKEGYNSQDLRLSFDYKKIELYAQYTNGQHRARPGEELTREDSFEIGIGSSF